MSVIFAATCPCSYIYIGGHGQIVTGHMHATRTYKNSYTDIKMPSFRDNF